MNFFSFLWFVSYLVHQAERWRRKSMTCKNIRWMWKAAQLHRKKILKPAALDEKLYIYFMKIVLAKYVFFLRKDFNNCILTSSKVLFTKKLFLIFAKHKDSCKISVIKVHWSIIFFNAYSIRHTELQATITIKENGAAWMRTCRYYSCQPRSLLFNNDIGTLPTSKMKDIWHC